MGTPEYIQPKSMDNMSNINKYQTPGNVFHTPPPVPVPVQQCNNTCNSNIEMIVFSNL